MQIRTAITIYLIVIVASGVMMIVIQATGGMPWVMLIPVISCLSSVIQYRKLLK